MLYSSQAIPSQLFFAERQRFNQWWLVLLLLVTNGIALYALFSRSEIPYREDEESIARVVGVMILALVNICLFMLRLDTQIRRDGIYTRFFPIQQKYRRYAWEDMISYRVRKYSPIGEYGGWGFRGFGKNRALNVSGNMGVQLEFQNGKRLLIGTQKPEELAKVLGYINEFNIEFQ